MVLSESLKLERFRLERFNPAIIASARIGVGLMWLANLHWKRPPTFGKTNGSGLYKFVKHGIDHPTFPPFSWVLRHVVAPHMSVFGWMTLLSEAIVAALLILGWQTKPIALLGAALSVSIGLSVAQAPNEWPWSYVLMVFLHLMLVATAAGRFGGLDSMRAHGKRNDTDRTYGLPADTPSSEVSSPWRCIAVLGALTVVVGLAGVVASANSSFTSRSGSLVGQVSYELKFLRFNLLAALLGVLIGVVAIVGWKLKRSALVWAGSGLALLCGLQVVAQWRTGTGGETGGILGGTGGTLGWWLVPGIGLAVAARTADKQVKTQ